MKTLMIAAALLACLATAATAAEKPLLSWERVSISGGLDYAWYGAPTETSAPIPFFEKEWEAGLYGAYTVAAPHDGETGPIVSIAGSCAYGFDNKLVRTKLGVRIGLFHGGK